MTSPGPPPMALRRLVPRPRLSRSRCPARAITGLISCQVACPVHTDARGYVRAIAEGHFEEAYLIARGPNPFASICGRICGAPCEAACRRGKIPRVDDDGRFVGHDRPIAIRALKRFACEQVGVEARPPDEVLAAAAAFVPQVAADAEEMAALLRARCAASFEPANGERVAIIGAGPAGLSAAHDLALMGFRPVVFESEPVAAGMLARRCAGLPPAARADPREVAVIEALGVEIRCGVTVGRDISLRRPAPRRTPRSSSRSAPSGRARSGCRASPGRGVFGGVDMLRAVALGEPIDLGREVVVIGGGNVAYDVARTRAAPGRLRHGAHGGAACRRRAASASCRSRRSKRCRPTRWRSAKATKKASSA